MKIIIKNISYVFPFLMVHLVNELINFTMSRSMTKQTNCAASEDSDQLRHPPSLIRVFAVRVIGSLGPKVSSDGERRL